MFTSKERNLPKQPQQGGIMNQFGYTNTHIPLQNLMPFQARDVIKHIYSIISVYYHYAAKPTLHL